MKTISSPLIGYLISLLFLMCGCSSEPTDKELLKKDTEALNKSLYSTKVHIYKMGKICVRASVAQDTLSPEFRKFKGRLDNIFSIVMPAKNAYPKELSIADYLSIYLVNEKALLLYPLNLYLFAAIARLRLLKTAYLCIVQYWKSYP